MLHYDGDGRPLLAERRMLERPGLGAARHHQAGMGVTLHVVGLLCLYYGLKHLISGHPDIEINGFRGLEQPVEMFINKGPGPVIKAKPLPYAIAQHEAAVIDADDGLMARNDPAIQPDADL